MPYGGELTKNGTKNVGWTARLQANYNKYFGGVCHTISMWH